MKKGEGMWKVETAKKVLKALPNLPKPVYDALRLLILEIKHGGPVRGDWKNYSKLGPNKHHCHIKTGRPTYVAVWEVLDNKIRIVEVIYAGTHENAPY